MENNQSLRTRSAKKMRENKIASGKPIDQAKNRGKPNERNTTLKIDMCDCLDRTCEGCWFPCKKCSSTKCGHECRKTRSWEYVSYLVEGSDVTVENPLLKE
ncbi:ARL14 effector protein [Parasteatoda tepidariorum]|uniref:ARL14 effector protein n=1 Tax=Parasteatoda tepidariorum TaxID=114398 RepID=UPI00077FB9DC|nr:ARL14 effector protein [Parasteatoda tepidariorum]